MAKNRYINTRFWNDGYVSELDPTEKLLFLYLLTNPATNISGIYELPVRNMAFETGLPEDRVRNILSRFGVDEKIYYIDGWVVIKNFLKHQKQGSSKVITGIAAELKLVPAYIREKVDSLSYLNSDSDPHSYSDSNSDLVAPERSTTVAEMVNTDKFQSLVRELAEIDYLSERQLLREAVEKFAPHWDERGEGQKKSRWQKEKSFDVCLRFRKWVHNNHNWNKDVQCRAAGIWHRKGETCFHEKPEPDYKNVPVSEFAKQINKRVPSET